MPCSRRHGGRAGAAFALVAAALLVASLLAVSTAGAARVKAPKRGQYVGQTHQKREFALYVAHRRVSRVTFEFDCTYLTGRATVRRLKLRHTSHGYRFAFHGRRAVSYADGQSEKATLALTGRFAGGGRKAHGSVRVKSHRCGGSGRVAWTARRTARRVTQPKSGTYAGKTVEGNDVTLLTSGRSIEVAALKFDCGDTTGSTALNDVPLHLTPRGYAFDIKAHGGVTYADDDSSENAAIDLSGRFTVAGTAASGRFRVRSSRCGDSGPISFHVKRSRSG
jgi:carbon monoxide dehydrogenase subunit G